MAIYPFPYLPLSSETHFKRSPDRPFPGELARQSKKTRRSPNSPEPIVACGYQGDELQMGLRDQLLALTTSCSSSSLSRNLSADDIGALAIAGGSRDKECPVGESRELTRSIIPSGSSLTSPLAFPTGFRDHLLTYTPAYGGDEADESVAEDDSAEAEEIRLVQHLVACAEAVACRDKAHASALLAELRESALVFGSSFQRVASCFVQGLADRLAKANPLSADTTDTSCPEQRTEALGLVHDACPYIRFGHFAANRAILEAFEGESFVHVVDLGMSLGLPGGHQWRDLMRGLAKAQPPVKRLRISAVGLEAERFGAIGEELRAAASGLGVPLEFIVVKTSLENLSSKDIGTSEGEAVVVNSVLQLHRVVKESRGALNSVLKTVHELAPRALVLVEQDSSHNGPFFLGRFMEALHYYSAIFDSVDAMLPKYDTKRAKMEQFYFGEEIKNIISCEGPARVERHERLDQWRRRMSRAGFQAMPMKMGAQARVWLAEAEAVEGYTVVEDKGCLVLGWKSRPVVAVSCWKC